MKEQIKYIISTLVIISITVFGVNAWNGLTASDGDTLNAAKWNELVRATTPTGAVMAFNLAACPTGWIAADGTNSTPDLRGTFIRGMNGSVNSRDIARTLGDYQADTMKGHKHYWTDKNGNDSMAAADYPAPSFYAGRGTSFYRSVDTGVADHLVSVGNPRDDGTNGTTRTGIETRPKNVALLYCQKL